MNGDESIYAVAQSQMESPTRTRAEAQITVQSSEAKPYDQTASPVLMEVLINEEFTGDLDGESTVRALQVVRNHRSASLVSMQRFRGNLGGRQGTFVLQGSEIVEKRKIKATWFVVPRICNRQSFRATRRGRRARASELERRSQRRSLNFEFARQIRIDPVEESDGASVSPHPKSERRANSRLAAGADWI
jgi:hypothetical protein